MQPANRSNCGVIFVANTEQNFKFRVILLNLREERRFTIRIKPSQRLQHRDARLEWGCIALEACPSFPLSQVIHSGGDSQNLVRGRDQESQSRKAHSGRLSSKQQHAAEHEQRTRRPALAYALTQQKFREQGLKNKSCGRGRNSEA